MAHAKNHDYHILPPSLWPFICAISTFAMLTGAVMWMKTGTPWLLVITAEDGPNGAHAVAEALVKVDAAGKVQGIEYPTPSWEKTTNTPKRVSAREIDTMVAAMTKP